MWHVFVALLVFAALARGAEELDSEGRRYVTRLRGHFERQFNKTCSKYPFVQRYVHQLENTGDKYVVFVYHEQGLRNGGLGDRIGGLITATTIALRLNRTLLIQSANDFGSLFRPYHPVDIHRPLAHQRYTWSNWTQWSHYNITYSNNDATEYDLWDCINCVTWKNRACGMDDGDVGQPIVKLRANRAFLCKWIKHTETVAHGQLAGLGITATSNLLEVAGCMMRLAMWPTDRLWEFAAKEVSKLDLFQRSSSAAPVNYGIQIGMHFRCGDQSYKHPGSYDRACMHDLTGKDPHAESDYMRFSTPDMLGRCAAELAHSYMRGTNDRVSELQQSVNVTQRASWWGGRRLRRQLAGNDSAPAASANASAPASAVSAGWDSVSDDWDTQTMGTALRHRMPVIYIASDNPASASQMNTTAAWPLTYVSPKGCHVEMNPSADCTTETTAYWLLLAGSDLIVTQTEGGMPVSAFSRYAAVYGLKGDSLRDAANCSRVTPFFDIGHRWNGNWFCD